MTHGALHVVHHVAYATAMADSVNLADKLARLDAPWQPAIVAQLNGQDVKVVKVAGEFVWHAHEDVDELFLVLVGEMRIELRDRSVRLRPGELFVVPRGVEHRPVATKECHVLLFEPTGTVNTGTTGGPMTHDANRI